MKTKVLITGVTGFVGGHILKGLAQDKNLILSVLLRNPDKFGKIKTQGSFHVYIGDITRPESLTKALIGKDVIIHCAALMSNFDSKTRREFYRVNVTGTENILRACDSKTLKQFVQISTSGVYGACSGYPSWESGPYGRALSAYEWSKKEAEIMVLKYAKHRGLPFTILRPSQLYGPGMYYGWPDTIRAINSGRMFVLGNGKAKIHLLNIKDLVKAVGQLLLNKSAINQIYNIAGPEIVSISKVFNLISGILRKKEPGRMPYSPMYLMSLFLKLIPHKFKNRHLALLTPHRIRFFSENHTYSTSKAARDLNYAPGVRMHDGFCEMINWCKEERLI
ncbi:MAG: NAD(P)-dependent oxidoreductase [Omnitrophica bacterium]|nr:NAD(P)-dependent oxidoreductase [Candidatus Omnitrophota bacterium]